MTEKTIDQMAKELGCNDATRVTEESINAKIVNIQYHTIGMCGKQFMFCGIEMVNGHVEIGAPSVCVDPKNFREAIGKKACFNNSYKGLYKLEGYNLNSKLNGV